jgi:hypothetical protein
MPMALALARDWHRPRGGVKSQTPISRLDLTEDNLLGLRS